MNDCKELKETIELLKRKLKTNEIKVDDIICGNPSCKKDCKHKSRK